MSYDILQFRIFTDLCCLKTSLGVDWRGDYPLPPFGKLSSDFWLTVLGSGAIDFDEFLATFQQSMAPPSKDELETSFKMMDKNGDGYLSRDEIKSGLMSCGEPMSDQSIDDMLAAADTNHDGKVSYAGM